MFFSNFISMDMKRFIEELNRDEQHDYIILMDRKMLSLYLSFNPTVAKRPILASSCIPFFREELKGKKLLIVDDILIHGRTIKNLYNELLESYAPASIDMKVLVIDEDNVADIYRDKSFQNLTYLLSMDRAAWRRVSRQIINHIRSTLTPLRTCVCYGLWHTSLSQDEIAKGLSLEKQPEYDPEYHEVDSYLLDGLKLLEEEYISPITFVDKLLIRFDFSQKKPDYVLVVPEVYFKPLHTDNIKEVLELLIEEKIGKLEVESLCHYLEYCTSQWVMTHVRHMLCRKFANDEICIKLDDKDLDRCFSRPFINRARNSDFMQHFDKIIKMPIKKYSLDLNTRNIMETLLLQRNKICNAKDYLKFLCDCGFADELLSEIRTMKRIRGARLSFLTKKCTVDYRYISYALMASISTYLYSCHNEWTNFRVLPGEQAFSFLLFTSDRVVRNTQDMLLDKETENIGNDEKERIIQQIMARLYDEYGEENRKNTFFDFIDQLCEYHGDENKLCQLSNGIEMQWQYIRYMTDVDQELI